MTALLTADTLVLLALILLLAAVAAIGLIRARKRESGIR
jgi:hypothetical protein